MLQERLIAYESTVKTVTASFLEDRFFSLDQATGSNKKTSRKKTLAKT